MNLRGYDPGQPMPAADALAAFLRALGVAHQLLARRIGPERIAAEPGAMSAHSMTLGQPRAGAPAPVPAAAGQLLVVLYRKMWPIAVG